MKTKRYYNSTWSFYITFYICNSIDELEGKEAYKNHGGIAWFDEEECNMHIAITKDDLCFNLIVHELYHAVDDIMHHKQVERHEVSNEPHAYMIGWLMDKAIKFYKKEGLKI